MIQFTKKRQIYMMERSIINMIRIWILLFMILNIKNKVILRNHIRTNYRIIVLVNLILDNQEIYNFELINNFN